MKARDLIKLLSEVDPDGDVFIVTDENWPFEHYVYGVAIREDLTLDEAPDEEGDPGTGDRWTISASRLPRNDALIVAGAQARYGDTNTWEVARRD